MTVNELIKQLQEYVDLGMGSYPAAGFNSETGFEEEFTTTCNNESDDAIVIMID